jgi:hypothetical protein
LEEKEKERKKERKKEETNIASPMTQYVAYQKLTSPPNLPPAAAK